MNGVGTQIDYSQLAGALLGQLQSMPGIRQKAVSSTPTTTYGHGPGGLFSGAGLSQQLFSAMILPGMGLQSLLPARPSRDANPLYGILTGVTATTGSEPTGVCDDPPTVGLTKLCTHSYVFGRQSRQSRVFELDRMGLLTNRGEFTDFILAGDPFNAQVPGGNVFPTVPGAGTLQNVARNEVAKAMFELGVGWSRDFARELYTGNPANNTAAGGRKYFYGLDILINTGYQDAVTGNACPAADSIIRSANNLEVNTNGTTYVKEITAVYRNLKFIAQKAGLEPASWVLAMPWGLFYELTEVWPCAYLSYRCQLATGSTNFVSADQQIKMRDELRGDIFNRTGQYLLIDGQAVPVVIDDAITETPLAGSSFRSTIYFVPLKVVGNTAVSFFEYLPYDVPGGAMEAARAFAPADAYYTTDGGRFLWHKKPPTNFCVQLLAKTEPRLLLLTPYIAARMTNVVYTPVLHERGTFTDDTSFFVDGGRTDYVGYGPSYYPPVP